MPVDVPSRAQWDYAWRMRMWPDESELVEGHMPSELGRRCGRCSGRTWVMGDGGGHVKCPNMGAVTPQVVPARHYEFMICPDCDGSGIHDGKVRYRFGSIGRTPKKGDECETCHGDAIVSRLVEAA